MFERRMFDSSHRENLREEFTGEKFFFVILPAFILWLEWVNKFFVLIAFSRIRHGFVCSPLLRMFKRLTRH